MAERYTDQQLLDAGFNPALIPIIKRESGGKSVGWEGLPGSRDYSPSGTDLSGYPLKSTGFPAWPGKMGPEGNSTAAGVAQIVGSTWDPIAAKLGVTGFSLQDQARVANELYRQSGTAPWRASEPGYRPPYYGTKEGYQPETGVTHITATEDNGLSVGGALFLSNLLKNAYPDEAAAPTGNSLLDNILKSSLPGNEPPPQPSPTDEAAKQLQQAPPPPPPPQTVPELQPGQPIPTPRITPIPQPTMPSAPMTPIPRQPSAPMTPMPGQPSVPAAPPPQTVPGTQDNPFMQPGAGGAPVGARDVPGTLDRNRFWNPNQIAPYNPPGVPDDRELQAGMPVPPYAPQGMEVPDIIAPAPRTFDYPQDDEYGHIPKEGPALTPVQPPRPSQVAANTGNNLLNQLLKQVSPISTAQAGELPLRPPIPVSSPRLVVARRMPDGTIRYGQPGQTHADLIYPNEQPKPGEPWFPPSPDAMGFAQPGGPYMTREQALEFVKQQEPARAERAHEPSGLQAEQYQRGQQAPPANTGNSLLDSILTTLGTGGLAAAGPLSKPIEKFVTERATPTDEMARYIADPLARTDVDLQTRAAAGPPSIGQSLVDLGQLVSPYTQGGGPLGTLTAGGQGRISGTISAAEAAARAAAEGGRAEPPRIGQSTDVAPFSAGGQPPAIPPTGVARVPGAEPPPPGPGMVPHDQVRAETAGPRPPKGDANESPELRKLRLDAMDSTHDKLWHNRSRQDAFMNKMLRKIQSGFEEDYGEPFHLTGEQKLQMERYLEWQPGMPPVAIEGKVKDLADRFVKPLRRLAAEDFVWLHKKGALQDIDPDVLNEMISDLEEGYLHRVRANRPGEQHPFSPFRGMQSLSRKADAQKSRSYYVLQFENGHREFVQGDAPPPGKPVYDNGAGGLTFDPGPKNNPNRQIGETRRATTEEVEKNTDTRFLHDPVLTQFLNFAQLRTARWNTETLEQAIFPMLKNDGLMTTDAMAAKRLGHQETIIPSLRGNYFTPRVANAFNDIYKAPSAFHEASNVKTEPSTIGKLFSNLNNAAINVLFLDPLPHIRNTAMDFILARGDLWWSPRAYLTGARAAREAYRDVMGRRPFYYDVMSKAGGALMGASNENRILYQALWNKAEQDMTRLPWLDNVAKKTGIWQTGKDMAKGLWNKAQSFMWAFHDTLFLTHVHELMDKGIPIEEAVRQTERFMATYRVRASVGERGDTIRLRQPDARALSRLMQDRSLTVFGRYHYNKLDILGNVLGDANKAMQRAGISFKDRKEAILRLGTLALWSTILQGTFNFIAQQVTGNPDARVPIPGAAGIPANLARVAYDLAWKQDLGQAAYDFAGGLASIVSPLPMLTELIGQWMNRDWVTNRDIAGKELPRWKQGVERGAHTVKTLVPPLDWTDWRHAVREFGGVSMPDPAAVERARKPHPMIRRGEQKDFNRRFPWLSNVRFPLDIPPDVLSATAPASFP